ncbi:MAG TPA: Crp/Fnr family transcriptional regulator [Patescibacteria group bacterium]
MQKAEIVKILSNVSLFKELPKEDIELISEVITYKAFEAGKVFIEEGVEGNEAYVILSGLTKVYRITPEGKEMYLAFRVPGETVGEFALLDDLPRSAHVKTIHKSEMLVIPKKEFVRIIKKSPSVAMGIIKMLAKRIRENIALTQDNETRRLRDRMLSILERVSSYFPNQEISMTHEELADILGATRPRVTEALHELVNSKKIKLSHKKITVL